MSNQPKTMTTVRGKVITVTSYKEAKRIMAAFNEFASGYAKIMAEDPATARRHLSISTDIQQAFDENMEVYQHFREQANIENAIDAMLHIAEQTKALND